jgi:uncharacterized protein YxjI
MALAYARAMPRFQIRQKLWAITDDFVIRDANDVETYRVRQKKLFSVGDQLHFDDMAGNELAFIKQAGLGDRYEIYRGGELVASAKQKWSLKPRMTVEIAGGEPLAIEGNFTGRRYKILRGDAIVATVSEQWAALSNAFGVEVADGEDPVLALALAAVIDEMWFEDN